MLDVLVPIIVEFLVAVSIIVIAVCAVIHTVRNK